MGGGFSIDRVEAKHVTRREFANILINLGNDEWRAFEQKCTHLSCAVFYQPKEGKIECPCHNGWFDARTGEPLQGPLPRLKVEARGDDIFVVPETPEKSHQA